MKIEIANCQSHLAPPRRLVRSACKEVLRQAGLEADLSIAYVDNEKITELNRQYLGRDESTDVIAFPLAEDGPSESEPLLGEIVVSAERALEEARKRRVPAERELMLYTIHGLLHLIGYDDLTARDAAAMRRKERQILSSLWRKSIGS